MSGAAEAGLQARACTHVIAPLWPQELDLVVGEEVVQALVANVPEPVHCDLGRGGGG